MRLSFSLSLLVLAAGCGTIHPRIQEDFPRRAPTMAKVAIVFPDIRVGVLYSGTDMLINSPEVSERSSAIFQEHARLLLEELGFEVESLALMSASLGVPFVDATVPWMHTGIQGLEGMPGTSRPIAATLDAQRVAATEWLTDRIMSKDPDYDLDHLPETMLFPGPHEDLAKYDLVLVSFGLTRAETDKEYLMRWVRNITLNLAMTPIVVANFLIPIPIALSLGMIFFEGTPDRSFYALVVFDPKTGKVEYTNDYYETGTARDEWVEFAVESLLADFPSRLEPEGP